MDLDAALLHSFDLAHAARANGDHPFSALLLVDGEVAATALNRVHSDRDLTAHAETELVRVLERDGKLDLLANGTVVASTEPCPMCVGAMFWAGARHVVFGLSAARLNEMTQAPGAPEYGFGITAREIGGRATPPMVVDGPYREDEAVAPHRGFWV
jgi:tRNA(Arg) A34 adenosine deaminase TadA